MALTGLQTILVAVIALCVDVTGAAEREPPTPGFDLVTCGSTIKIAWEKQQDFRLHSHEVAYGSGSGQQSVTMKKGNDDTNSYFTVSRAVDSKHECKRGSPIKDGKVIRLQHVNTKKWLHSHREFKSPLSQNQEVSGFGDSSDSNTADNWVVEIPGKGNWGREKSFRLKHVDTGFYLHATGRHQFGRPINGQREVSAISGHVDGTLWIAMEGLFVKVDSKK